jgi:hypothetical protein
MPPTETTIAQKHTELCIKVKSIAESSCPDWRVYLATYTTGRAGQSYQRIEQESGEDFWSIRALTPPPHRRLKDPDVRVTHGHRTDNETKTVLVSDFVLLKQMPGARLQGAIKVWNDANADVLIADICTRVDNIPSLRDIFAGNANCV